MQRDFNTLLIPVESQVRELDGKILLASIAAEQGFNVIIGSRAHIHYYASKVTNAIYIAKSMRRFSNRMFKILHGLGHRIVALDEEALVRLPDQQYYTHRLSPITFNYIDHLFCWGRSDAEVFKNYPHYHNQPIHEVGNPRIDILRPELRDYFAAEKNALIKKYGEYILINTNFGQVNHFIPDVGNQEASRDKNFSRNDGDDFITQRYAHKKTLFEAFKKLIPYLVNTFKDTHFILRPHPSESSEAWQHQLNQYNNVTVTNAGNVIPWIMGAKTLISNGCTTSIEATVLQKPTLGFYPVFNELVDDKLPKALCDIAETKEHLAEKISKLISENSNYTNDKQAILSQHISSLSGEFSCEKIISALNNNYSHSHYKHHNVLKRIPSIIHNDVRTLVKHAKSKKASSRNSTEYHKYRFPHINAEQVNERIKRLSMLTGKLHNVQAKELADDIFVMST